MESQVGRIELGLIGVLICPQTGFWKHGYWLDTNNTKLTTAISRWERYGMDERVAKLRTSRDATKLADNARRLGQSELAASARVRANELKALEEGYISPAEQAIATALYAYEEQQTAFKGHSFRANRTRQMLARHGALAAAERMVLNRRPSKGFEVLEEAGLQELSFEAIIVRFPDEFSDHAIAAARARLSGDPPPTAPALSSSNPTQSLELRATKGVVPNSLDAEAQLFLSGFNEPGSWFKTRWMPRYRRTTELISEALAKGRPQDLFETIWKTADNAISNAGQGLLKYETVDGMRDDLVQVIQEVHDDGSPARFNEIVSRFENWKVEGRVAFVPRLLIARTFAGVHPNLYHTTVDVSSHNDVLLWFAEHTGLAIPVDSSWATRAQALVAHLNRIGSFGAEHLARNMFPWFVVEQLTARRSPKSILPGHRPRAATAFAEIPSGRREVELRHNAVQTALFARLVDEYGENWVWTEYPTGTGGYADAVARQPDGSWHLYEIKIADTAAEVVRQAMGQLLEYGFRSNGLEPTKIFAVGEPLLDDVTGRFIERLQTEFHMNIEYLKVDVPKL